jgi:hypothetical protein
MPLTTFKATAGTIKEPQNTKSTESCWTDTDHVHFPEKADIRSLPAYTAAAFGTGSVTMQGTCRAEWAGRIGAAASPYYVFGTHYGLYAAYLGVLYNITPFADQKSEDLGNNPLDVHSGSATMDIHWTAHGLSVGDEITLSGSTTVDAVDAATYINVTHRVSTVISANEISVTLGTTAGSTTTGGGDNITASTIGRAAVLGANPISVVNATPTVTIAYTAHGMAIGDRFKLNFSTAVGGITTAMLNKEHIVASVPDANTITFTAGGNASSTASGGGSVASIFKQVAAGNENQTLGVGFGFGIFGFGVWGAPFYSATAQSYPRIPSFDALGSELVMCPGDYLAGDGQKLYIWDGNLNVAPTVLSNAPTNCKWIKVVNNSVVALCDTTIKISELGNGTVWSGITYTAIDVQRAWSLISAFGTGEKAAVIFAPEPYLLRFVGGEWDLVELGQQYPIVAPAAACSLNDGLIWYGSDGNLYFFDGGAVRTINNTQNGDYIRRNFNGGKAWHCFMMTDYKYSQAYLYYPSTGETNPDSYMIFNPKQPSFTLGKMSRTSAQRNAEVDSVFYMTNGADVYRHFLVSPPTFNWSARSAFFYTDNGDYRVRVNRIYPDAQISQDVNFKIIGKEYPQSIEADYGNQTLTTASQAMSVTGAGRLLSVEFSGSGDFMLNNLKMEMQVQGRNS